MRREFLKLEKNWFQKLLIPDFPNKEIIEEQLEQGYVTDMDIRTSWASIGLETDCKVPFPHAINVPVIMNVNQADGTFIGFHIVLNRGFISELAIYHIAGYDIPNYEEISFNNITYEINV